MSPTRAAPYGSPEWRAWKHQHHWAPVSTAVDPLGAGNTALIAALGVTPLGFWDVRKNMTLNGGNVSQLADVSGAGTYGPALAQANATVQPAWDGTVINTTGSGTSGGGTDWMQTTGAFDLSTALTFVLVADQAGLVGKVAADISTSADATNFRYIVGSGSLFHVSSSGNGTGATSTAQTGTGNIRLAIATLATNGTVTIEVPTTAQATHAGTAIASGSAAFTLGATFAGTAGLATRFRAALIWAGSYTTAQRDTLKTYATIYHGAVLA